MAARKTPAKAVEAVVEKLGDICRACWPDGWPHLSHSASCEHGDFARDPEATVPEQTPETNPDDGDGKQPEQPPAGEQTGA